MKAWARAGCRVGLIPDATYDNTILQLYPPATGCSSCPTGSPKVPAKAASTLAKRGWRGF